MAEIFSKQIMSNHKFKKLYVLQVEKIKAVHSCKQKVLKPKQREKPYKHVWGTLVSKIDKWLLNINDGQ